MDKPKRPFCRLIRLGEQRVCVGGLFVHTMSALPNLACLNLSHSVVPTSGTGGRPERGGGAARAVYEKNDLLEEIAQNLKTLQPESVPKERRIHCDVDTSFKMTVDDDDPDIKTYSFLFEMNFKYDGLDIPPAGIRASELKNAFTDTPEWEFTFAQGLKEAIHNATQVSSGNLENCHTYKIQAVGSNRFRSMSASEVYLIYEGLYNKWAADLNVRTEFTKKMTSKVLRAINMTGIEVTYNAKNSTVPGPNTASIVVNLGVDAVTDAEALMFPNPSMSPDIGLQRLLTVLRREDENRKARAAVARAAAAEARAEADAARLTTSVLL